MQRYSIILAILAALGLVAAPMSAQMSLPGVNLPGPRQVLGPIDRTLDQLERMEGEAARTARDLLRNRERDISRFLRRNEDFVEPDRNGDPARRGELLLMDVDQAAVSTLSAAGFVILEEEEIKGIDLTVTRIALPRGMELAEAEEIVSALDPGAIVAPDNIHFQSGSAPELLAAQAASGAVNTVPVGMIDGAPSQRLGTSAMRGFVQGAPVASDHGSAIAFLLRQAGVTNIRAADVYGTDRAGGNALAIARALGWLVANGSRVVTISLVGPHNAVVERAIGAAQREGAVIVAAVGNNGPAAPAAYPASYDGVIAVTGVDGRNRALIEAGRALHLDYSAPGADIVAEDADGNRVRLRGTSFATPLAAARIAAAMRRGGNWRARVDQEAEDLGEPGADDTFGRGLLCGECARR